MSSDLPEERLHQGEPDRPIGSENLEPTADNQPNIAVQADNDDRFQCRACGYTYNPSKGDPTSKIIAGTPFTVLPIVWKCPTCGAKKSLFINIGTVNEAAGFKANQRYGLGVNTLTQGQKSLLIFGGMGLGILLLLSLYSLN
jgi:rubredoxin